MGAFAQTETDSAAVVNKGITPVKEVYPQKEEDGDLYHGLTRKLTFDRMIPPYGLEVTYDKQGGRCGKCHPCKGYRKEFP